MALVTEARKAKSSSAVSPAGGIQDRRQDVEQAREPTEITIVEGAPEMADGRKGSKYLVGNLNEDRKFHENR